MTQREIKDEMNVLIFRNSIQYQELEHIKHTIAALEKEAQQRTARIAENMKLLDELQQQLQEPKTAEA